MKHRAACLLYATTCVGSGIAWWLWQDPADIQEPGSIPKGKMVSSLGPQIPHGPWGQNALRSSGSGRETPAAGSPPIPSPVRRPQTTEAPIIISITPPTFSAGSSDRPAVAGSSAGRSSPPRSLPGPSAALNSEIAETPAPLLAVPFSRSDPGASAVIPAVLADMDPSVGHDPPAPPGLDRMTDEFLSQVTQGSQDPKDPDYQRLWEESQTMSDIRMKAAYGDAAWLKRHQEAYRQALGNAAADRPEGP